MYFETLDKSVIDSRGKIVFFSLNRFLEDIVQGNKCFICGASPQAVPFNDEHVVPDWILRRFNLHGRLITLPNGTRFRYGQFKIPCCQVCNSTLGDKIEKPLGEMFDKGYKSFTETIRTEGPWGLFCWMCLLFLKTHLKDQNLPLHRDLRNGKERIGELHSWEDLHHIHCMARAFYTGCDLKIEALGSLLVVPAKILPYWESFDYLDLSFSQTMLLRIDGIAVIAVFNDSQACLSMIGDFISNIGGPLSPLQLRELAVRMAFINIHLADRPRFRSSLDILTEQYEIDGERPAKIEVGDWKEEVFGMMMHNICGNIVIENDQKPQILENIKTGRYSFIFDDKGNFSADHMDLIGQEDHTS